MDPIFGLPLMAHAHVLFVLHEWLCPRAQSLHLLVSSVQSLGPSYDPIQHPNLSIYGHELQAINRHHDDMQG